MVIGELCKAVPQNAAMDVIGGYHSVTTPLANGSVEDDVPCHIKHQASPICKQGSELLKREERSTRKLYICGI